ncbi:MAG: substrate-binding domain-containing protein [Lachnospiraceae bacterium]|nr:substrate-binding domain-containing protein [Lachnospiraceae bacterium]
MKKDTKRYGTYITLIVLISANILLGFFLIRMRTVTNSGDPAGGGRTYDARYAFICEDSEDDLYAAVYDSAKLVGEENGDYVEFMGRDLSVIYSPEDLMDASVEAGMDGIIVESAVSDRMNELIDRAVDKGIPVVALGTDQTASKRNAYVGCAYYSVGQTFGSRIVSLSGDEVKNVTVLMTKEKENSNHDIIFSGIKNYIESAGLSQNFSLTAEFIDDSQPYGAEESISALMGRDEIPDVIICLQETATTCACQSLVDMNRVGETDIIGFYVNDTILSAIKDGVLLGTVVMDAETMGKYCIETLDNFRENGVVNEYMPVNTYVIDGNNVDDFIEEAVGDNDGTKSADQ